jgi:hypothetical protein
MDFVSVMLCVLSALLGFVALFDRFGVIPLRDWWFPLLSSL